ncbi:FAD-binding oxidoreductase [Nocardia donostiensis]|uniref:FAD-binding oxidoreductase n=1 Tax=Nocardia donostiensis TaxID=1538463 RepID=A0A1W0B2G5_9NOCA|nr:FAD-binding oxidoreductase [Nocardia donostiensis]ONM46538.1 FAD-binding oxidoreductase [Nocardia donostiensis]OQS16715.1 FAD-binding oxidoreductase [Nocardia donostiensis]OQS23178.1 FAD-binding oxidoreductase [Nocardia donostiensis]
MVWDAWGIPAGHKPLSAQIRGLLGQVFGVSGEPVARRDEGDVPLREPALSSDRRAGLAAIVGADHVSTEHRDRLRHAGGKSTLDLLRRRGDGPQDAPDAVVFPADHDQVLAVLAHCSGHGIAVVPFGGGTSVVGGLDPVRGRFETVIALDLRRLDSLIALDPVSGTATLGAGVTGPRAEQLLGTHGLSLGHFPQSFEFASIGGFAATRSSGQASAGYGRFDDMVQHLCLATPGGTVELGRAPASAAGPDLRELFVGSEGTLGVITEVTVRVHPIPETVAYQAWSFPDFDTGAAALRTVVQTGAAPTVLRLSDEVETALNLARAGSIGGDAVSGCLAVTTVEGTRAHVAARCAEAAALLRAAGGTDLGEAPAREWEHGRFAAPYLRDALLDLGVLCETLETATSWGNLAALKEQVTTALTEALTAQQTPPVVMCHISHTYPTGASLYFTVLAKMLDDPIAQWLSAKTAAGDAIMAAGGTITHHHAVGADHRDWLPDEIGNLGVRVLRAVKQEVDPAGILNPGKLLP